VLGGTSNVLLRDRLLERLAEMGARVDYPRLAADVLGIRNAPPQLARRLVDQALVVEDRREAWERVGARVTAEAPQAPGVYVLRDERGAAVYVGKATNLRRRLRAHFSGRRWRGLTAAFVRACGADWQVVGSELEALLREASLIQELQPSANVQVTAPNLDARAIPAALRRDVLVVVPSVDPLSAELVGARVDGDWMIQRTARSGADLKADAARVMRFFHAPERPRGSGQALAPIVFSWLAGRGASASRLDPQDFTRPGTLRAHLAVLLADEDLFAGRIVVIDSKIRTPRRARP
jgi:predicted GIY-YIG superfamily endonuclease